jgi:hypothetical protein
MGPDTSSTVGPDCDRACPHATHDALFKPTTCTASSLEILRAYTNATAAN